MSKEQREAWRRRWLAAQTYRPAQIRLLLVAEAPPEELDRHFYFEDVRTQDGLFRETCKVVFGEREPKRYLKSQYLRELQLRAIFLIDLKRHAAKQKGEDLSAYVPALLKRITRLRPEYVVLVKRDLWTLCHEALRDMAVHVDGCPVPFPGYRWQPDFRGLEHALDAGGMRDLIHPGPW